MQRRCLSLCIGILMAAVSTFLLQAAILAEGPVLQHQPPAQVYEGVGFQLKVKPLLPLKRVIVYLTVHGTQTSLAMQGSGKQFTVNVPGKLTKGLKGEITYYFEAFDGADQPRKCMAAEDQPYRTRLVPQPAAAIVTPQNRATMDTFTVVIGLNEAFAIVPTESFRVYFNNKDVTAQAVKTTSMVGFVAGPGLKNGTYTVKFETKAIPGWKMYAKSWSFRLRKALPDPVDPQGPLTLDVSVNQDTLNQDIPTLLNVSWDGLLLNADALGFTPTLSPLTLWDATPLNLMDNPVFGAQGGITLGRLSYSLLLGVMDPAWYGGLYSRLYMGNRLELGALSLNLAAVMDVSSPPPPVATPAQPYNQSYIASLGLTLGSDERGQAGLSAEAAFAMSFVNGRGAADWTLINTQAALAGAPASLVLLSRLGFLMQRFPLPYVDMSTNELPQIGLGFHVSAWGPLGPNTYRLEYSYLADGFLSLGSPLYPGQTLVLIVARDPDRAATKPFTYDVGPLDEDKANVDSTFGLHMTGFGFPIGGDPFRMGVDYFRTTWDPGASWQSAETYRLFLGYYTYLDLNVAVEYSVITGGLEPSRNRLGIEATATRKIGNLTLTLEAGAHQDSIYGPDVLNYGFGLDVQYELGGLQIDAECDYGEPGDYADPAALSKVTFNIGVSWNF